MRDVRRRDAEGQSAEVNKRVHSPAPAREALGGRVKHLGAAGAPPWVDWVPETTLYTSSDGSVDPSEKTKLARWRAKGRVFGDLDADGAVMIAVHPGRPKMPVMTDDPYSLATASLESADEHDRHRALEMKLRAGPTLEDGSWGRPMVRFTLTHDEWEELLQWREVHGYGAEIGAGPARHFWRPTGAGADMSFSKNGDHRVLSWRFMQGRSLA